MRTTISPTRWVLKSTGIVVIFSLSVCAPFAKAADRTGKQVVEAVCIECHGEGKDGAPRIGNHDDWNPRAKYGLSKLNQHAMNGVRKMPAHGGKPAISDLELTRAISYMVSGGHTPDPSKTFGTVTHGSGEQIVAKDCGNCHQEGKNGAPRIGDADAWRPRLAKGIDGLVTSAVQGHNQMQSRGGFVNLSDVDIRAAISFMVSKLSSRTK